jgi:hypothetical protein
MLKICIARLRGAIHYREPLQHILDSFCELLAAFVLKHQRQYNFSFYGISFNAAAKPIRDNKAIKNADVIIVPSEQEFHFHVPGYFFTRQQTEANARVRALAPYIKNKRVILLRSDRGDTLELLRDFSFKCQFEGSVIDEMDFEGGIHGLKYLFLRRRLAAHDLKLPRRFDFAYWGSDKRHLPGGMKSQDERHIILRKVDRDAQLRCFWIGRLSGIQVNLKIRPMSELITPLLSVRSTVCFNWLDSTATTARYHEALALGVIPLVWRDYDCNSTLVKLAWQRVESFEELHDRILELRSQYKHRFAEVTEAYVVRPLSYYHERFTALLEGLLD